MAENIKVRMMPHNHDAEQAVLGSILIDENVAVNVIPVLRELDFYSETHRVIYKAMTDIYNRSVPIDFITLNDELNTSGTIGSAGGINYITALTNIVPSAVNHMHYADIVKKTSVLRRLIGAGNKIIEEAYNSNDDIMAIAEKAVYDISAEDDKSAFSSIDTALNTVIRKFELISMDSEAFRGIPTGFSELDKILHGLQAPDLIVVGARPGVGKTSFGMNLVQHAALSRKKDNSKYSCAVFSLEMSVDQIVQRLICATARVSMASALGGTLGQEDWQKLFNAKTLLHDAEIYVDDNSMITPMEILSKCRRLKHKNGLDLVLIDYLQLMADSEKGIEKNRQQTISDITRKLKIAAKELNVPIVLLSQLKRPPSGTKQPGSSNIPELSDLRESGAIEQDADIVMFLHRRHAPSDMSVPDRERNTCDLIIAKHRNGALDTVPLYWHGERTSFYSINSPDAKQQIANAKRIFKRTEDSGEPGDRGDYIPPAGDDIEPEEPIN